MIRVIAICVFKNNGRILVAQEPANELDAAFARPLGGGVEDGETSAEAVVREIREELGQNVIDLRLLGVLENIFHYRGTLGHEIVFVYDGRFEDVSLYDLPEIPINEAGWTMPAKWREIESFDSGCRLVPDGLAKLLMP